MSGIATSFRFGWALLIGVLLASNPVQAALLEDQTYAEVDGIPLKYDLHLPDTPGPHPLIVWVHGGAWRSGTRKSMPLQALVDQGYAIASVDYRLSTQARFPAQIHDIKAAIRHLRKNARELGLQPERFILAGASAGGHLAALAGLSSGVQDLEGNVGDAPGISSEVQAILDFYGASNLTTILAQSTPHGLSVRVPALELLLGQAPDQVPDLARLASPVFHLDPKDPPLFLIHGAQDPQMPVNQALELWVKAQGQGIPVHLKILPDAQHGGSEFYSPTTLTQVMEFLSQHGLGIR